MIERRFGRIVNITSFVVKELYPNMALSNTVRVALTGAMASLAREAIQHGVTVNNILPGLMDTGALQRVIADRARRQNTGAEEVKMEMAASIPAGRLVRLTISARFACSCARARPATSPDRMLRRWRARAEPALTVM